MRPSQNVVISRRLEYTRETLARHVVSTELLWSSETTMALLWLAYFEQKCNYLRVKNVIVLREAAADADHSENLYRLISSTVEKYTIRGMISNSPSELLIISCIYFICGKFLYNNMKSLPPSFISFPSFPKSFLRALTARSHLHCV